VGKMRLIDADALIERIYEYQSKAIDTEDIIHSIKTMPTAYDIEKVVAELEEMEEKAIKVKNVTVSSYACGMIHKAIDIVRKGGME
jgi:hypothetical protein